MKANLRRVPWIWALGVAAVIFAARIAEIHRFTGDVAINDQWKIEAADLLAPWLEGRLDLQAFLAPHFEHLPVWTRLSAWLQVALTGRWDPLVQTTVNSLLFAAFAFLITRWIASHLRPIATLSVGLVLVAGCALPHAWENITWGFQSQFPFALLFLYLHTQGSFSYPAATRGWWWAQLAGFAGLFTLAGMWIAPLAVPLTAFWTQPRGSRMQLVPLGLAVTGLVLIAVIKANAPPWGAFAQTAPTPLHFLNAWLDLLGWPAGWPGAYLIVNLPLILLGLRLRGAERSPAFDRSVLALGIWGAGQAAALAFARGADYGGYVSRYGELHLVLVLANALAFARLAPLDTMRRKAASSLLAIAWSGVVVFGWWQLANGGHTAHFHNNSAGNNQTRLAAVQAYLQHGDRTLLETPGTRQILYQDVNQITRLLDTPGFRDVLPSAINPANQPDPVGKLVRYAQSQALWLALMGGLLLLVGALLLWRMPVPTQAALLLPQAGLPWRWPLAFGTAAFLLLFSWNDPLVFDSASRWRRLIEPANGSIGPLEVRIVQGSHDFSPERLRGAAPLSPPALRVLFTGTEPEGPGLTCTAWSRAFAINHPWLVVPYAGWPVSHGNGLRLKIVTADKLENTEIEYSDPNPRGIQFWTVDLRNYLGQQARLVLYDGRTESEAWVAAAAPIATDDPTLAAHLQARLQKEGLINLHTSLAITSLALLIAAATNFLRLRAATV